MRTLVSNVKIENHNHKDKIFIFIPYYINENKFELLINRFDRYEIKNEQSNLIISIISEINEKCYIRINPTFHEKHTLKVIITTPFKLFKKENDYPQLIPKKIMQTTDSMTKRKKETIDIIRFYNPEYEYVLF